jgi:hypothetical protein
VADITATTEPKSDQLNADSLIGGKTLTIKVTQVSLVLGEQPVIINYENDNGRPYKPGKSMRRVLVHCWGADGNNFVGRSMTLYCDEKVTFGGMAVGGIRISHMSNIDKPITMALTTTRSKRAPFTVKPLGTYQAPQATAQNSGEPNKPPVTPPEAGTMAKPNQSLHDELAAFCEGDTAKMDTLLKELSYYKTADGKELSFGTDRLPTASEKWAGKVLTALRKYVAEAAEPTGIDTPPFPEDQDIPF